MRATLPRCLVAVAAACAAGTAACGPDLFEDIDPWKLEYHLTVSNTVEGTPPDSFESWMVAVFRIVGVDTSSMGGRAPIDPMGSVRYDFSLFEWQETDTALVCLEVHDPCAVAGDTARSTRLAVGETRNVLFHISCP